MLTGNIELWNGWWLRVEENLDPIYPGISMVLLPEDSECSDGRFRLDFEWKAGRLVPKVLMWNDPSMEDPSVTIHVNPECMGGQD